MANTYILFLGYMAAFLTTFSAVPQLYKVGDMPVIAANAVGLSLNSIILWYKARYG